MQAITIIKRSIVFGCIWGVRNRRIYTQYSIDNITRSVAFKKMFSFRKTTKRFKRFARMLRIVISIQIDASNFAAKLSLLLHIFSSYFKLTTNAH